jgi:2-C-methyl-D-erythritol 4-phosphate cytidylyltransferase
VPAALQARARSLLPDERVVIAAGGSSRRASVARALEHVRSRTVVVHDAARPFVSPRAVAAVVSALEDADGAITALPVDETLKRVEDRRVLDTIDRSSLWRAQTPQAFRAGSLRAAHERAAAEGFEATDDAQLLERYGGTITVVQGTRENLKLTYPEDFVLAEAMARARA